MLLFLLSNKYTLTVLAIVSILAYCYILKPGSLFDDDGELKSAIWTPELIAVVAGVAVFAGAEYLFRATPQEVVIVADNTTSPPAAAAPPLIRRADSVLRTPFRP